MIYLTAHHLPATWAQTSSIMASCRIWWHSQVGELIISKVQITRFLSTGHWISKYLAILVFAFVFQLFLSSPLLTLFCGTNGQIQCRQQPVHGSKDNDPNKVTSSAEVREGSDKLLFCEVEGKKEHLIIFFFFFFIFLLLLCCCLCCRCCCSLIIIIALHTESLLATLFLHTHQAHKLS